MRLAPVAFGAARSGRRRLDGEGEERGGELVDVVRRPLRQLATGVDQRRGGEAALVVGRAARDRAEGRQPVQCRDKLRERRLEVRLGQRRRLRVEVVALAEDPPGAHGERPQPLEPHAGAQQARQPAPGRPRRRVARGELAEPLLPQAAALEVRPERIELLERGVHPGLDRELAQQPAREPVDGADGRVV